MSVLVTSVLEGGLQQSWYTESGFGRRIATKLVTMYSKASCEVHACVCMCVCVCVVCVCSCFFVWTKKMRALGSRLQGLVCNEDLVRRN